MKYDVLVIGAGPAGMTAALYAVRAGLKVGIVSKDIGGTTNSILNLENWPGFEGSGTKLMKSFYDQLKNYDVKFIMEGVEEIQKNKEGFLLKTKKQKIDCESLILATGTERKKLNVPGEKELTGKGVSYCVTCDAFFFKGKTVTVIGGSDCAATSALGLSDLAKKVYVIYRGEKLRCEDINSKRLEEKSNVEIIYNGIPKKINGDKKVENLEVDVKGELKKIETDGIFIEIGAEPLTKIFETLGIQTDKGKYIVVDDEMKTSVEGIFAVGDITNQKLKQVIVASGQGAIAGKNIYDWIKRKA
jgi:thioredoxin reductase (NADPH)